MATYTVTTTVEQDQAIELAYQQSRQVPALATVPTRTKTEFVLAMITSNVLTPMQEKFEQSVKNDLTAAFNTVPVENRAVALAEIRQVILEHQA